MLLFLLLYVLVVDDVVNVIAVTAVVFVLHLDFPAVPVFLTRELKY